MYFPDLDEAVRARMVEEIRFDTERGALCVSGRLTQAGRARWPDMLSRAAASGTPAGLAGGLRAAEFLVTTETSHRNGMPYGRAVPDNAADTLAEGEFSRFYIRAVCAIALERGQTQVVVYRAKNVATPPADSNSLIGSSVAAQAVLDDLRTRPGIDAALGIPPGPNSGLSVRLLPTGATLVLTETLVHHDAPKLPRSRP
jgi:hypothetical protein